MRLERILEAAADLVEECWAQGNENVGLMAPPYCLGTALSAATCLEDDTLSTITATSAALAAEIGTSDLVQWNDTPGRTQAEVVTAIRNAKRWL
jgi:hypothetical protein